MSQQVQEQQLKALQEKKQILLQVFSEKEIDYLEFAMSSYEHEWRNKLNIKYEKLSRVDKESYRKIIDESTEIGFKMWEINNGKILPHGPHNGVK